MNIFVCETCGLRVSGDHPPAVHGYKSHNPCGTINKTSCNGIFHIEQKEEYEIKSLTY